MYNVYIRHMEMCTADSENKLYTSCNLRGIGRRLYLVITRSHPEGSVNSGRSRQDYIVVDLSPRGADLSAASTPLSARPTVQNRASALGSLHMDAARRTRITNEMSTV